MPGIRIVSTGSYLPQRIVDGLEVGGDRNVAKGMGELFESCQRRHYASADETSIFMGIEAAKRALEAAPEGSREIDHILHWSLCADFETPRDGAFIATALGMGKTAATFIDVGCASYLAMMKVAAAFLRDGFHKRILLVSVANWATRAFAPGEDIGPVGDGAGAMILEACAEDTMLGFAETRDSRFESSVVCRSRFAGGRDEVMRSNRIEGMRDFVENDSIKLMRDLIVRSGAKVDWFIPNQPSARVNQVWREGIEVPADRMLETFNLHGNLMAATHPIILDVVLRGADEDKKPKRGENILFFTTGSGFHLAAMLLRY